LNDFSFEQHKRTTRRIPTWGTIGAMTQSPDLPVARPAACPYCNATVIETLAKIITASSFWRCRKCEGTWTGASLAVARLPIR